MSLRGADKCASQRIPQRHHWGVGWSRKLWIYCFESILILFDPSANDAAEAMPCYWFWKLPKTKAIHCHDRQLIQLIPCSVSFPTFLRSGKAWILRVPLVPSLSLFLFTIYESIWDDFLTGTTCRLQPVSRNPEHFPALELNCTTHETTAQCAGSISPLLSHLLVKKICPNSTKID